MIAAPSFALPLSSTPASLSGVVSPRISEIAKWTRNSAGIAPQTSPAVEAQPTRLLPLAAATIASALVAQRVVKKHRLTRRAAAKGEKPARVGDFITQLRHRLGKRRLVLEEELHATQKAALSAEEGAKKLEHSMREELEEERSLNKQLKSEMETVCTSYQKLSDELEITQQESAEKAAINSATIAKMEKELETAHAHEVQLTSALNSLEQKEKELIDVQKKLKDQLDDAIKREDKLEVALSSKTKLAEQVAEELLAKEAEKQELQKELDEGRIREEEFKLWADNVEKDNKKVREQLEKVQLMEQELRTKFAAELNKVHDENKELDEALKAAEAKFAKLLQTQQEEATKKKERKTAGSPMTTPPLPFSPPPSKNQGDGISKLTANSNKKVAVK